MRRNGPEWTRTAAASVAALGLALGLTTDIAAQQPPEARIQELIRAAAQQAGVGQLRAGAGQQQPAAPQTPPPIQPGATPPVVHLTLDDAVKLALDRNLDIAVQRLNPQINDIAIASVRSVYHPVASATFGPQSSTFLPTNQTTLNSTGAAPVTDVLNYNGGISQSVPWGGGSISGQFLNFRRTTTSNTATYNPLFQAQWAASYTQPLLRNLRIDSIRQQLQVTKINREASDVQLRAVIVNTVSNVRNAYWDYVFAVQSVEVAKQSLALAEQLVKDNQTRVEVGTMAPIDVVQAQSQAATQRQTLVQAQATVRTAELALKRLIVGGTQDPNWNARLDPVDRPEFVPEAIDLQAAVRRALSERTDIAIARMTTQENDITLKLLQDQLKPQADVTAQYQSQGLGGTFLQRDLHQLGSPITATFPGGIGDAFGTLFSTKYPVWSVQMNVSYPLGPSAQQANAARARVQLNQVQAQLRQLELQVATDVTNAVVTVQSNIERVQAAQAARELAQKQLDAENSKFQVGMSTNYNVVLAQRDLATAQNNELQAVLAYRRSLVELDRLQQTTLQSQGITVLAAGGGGSTGATAGGTGGTSGAGSTGGGGTRTGGGG